MELDCTNGTMVEIVPSTGPAVAACVIFILVLPCVMFNFKLLPVGTVGALLVGATLMVASVTGTSDFYTEIGQDGNMRFLLLTLSIMVLVQYFLREQIFSRVLNVILNADISSIHFLLRVTVINFVTSALFSIDTCSLVVIPAILQLWRSQKRPASDTETLLLAMATSANLGSILTVYGNTHMAVIAARTASQDTLSRLDMVSICMYLALPAVAGYILNLIFIVIFFKLRPKPPEIEIPDVVIELQDVEQSLITPNAIIDHIIEEEGTNEHSPVVTLQRSSSEIKPKRPKSVEFLDNPRLPKFSVGDICAKGVQAQGPPSLFIGGKGDEDESVVNKDQCHSLYNLDKIGYIAVSERRGLDELGMPRTISFYHSFSDLDSWQYTRDTVVNRFEHDHPRKMEQSPLARQRRMSSRGRLESVQFVRRRKFPSQRRTSVLYRGLQSEAMLCIPKLGVYRSFSGLSPNTQFLLARREDVDRERDITNREFVPSNSRFFRVFLVLVFLTVVALMFVRIPQVNFDIGLVPVCGVVVTTLVDAIWNRRSCPHILRRLNWSVLINYLAAFVFVRGLIASHLPLWIWTKMNFVSTFDSAVTVITFVVLVTCLTNVLGGMTLTLLITGIPTCGASLPMLVYLAWTTTIASAMTLHSGAGTMLTAARGEELGKHSMTYWGYLRYALPSSVVILVVGVCIIAGLTHATELVQ